MSGNCDVAVIFPVHGKFGEFIKPEKLTFLLMITFYLTKTQNKTKKFPKQLSKYCFK